MNANRNLDSEGLVRKRKGKIPNFLLLLNRSALLPTVALL
jgi:hypothetical protein